MAERTFMSNRPQGLARRREDIPLPVVEDHHLERLNAMGYQCRSVKAVAETEISLIISGVIDPEKMSCAKAKTRVKKAVEKAGHKKILVKIIGHKLTDERFIKKEMTDDLKSMYRLQHHPNVAQTYGYFRCDDIDASYVISELAPGVHVNVFMASKKYDVTMARDIFKQITDAVKFVHSCDIIHRDLTPSCIVVDETARIKIRDFGLSPKLTHLTLDLMSECSKRVYTAPEVIKSRYYETKMSDVYSMGIILFEMLTGKVPYTGVKSKILQQIHDRKPAFAASVLSDAMTLIREMIHPDPKKRPKVVDCIKDGWVKSKVVPKIFMGRKFESASTGSRKQRHAKLTSASNGTGLYMYSLQSQKRSLTHKSNTDECGVKPRMTASSASPQTQANIWSPATLQSPVVKKLQSFPSPHPQAFTSDPSCSIPKKKGDRLAKVHTSNKNITQNVSAFGAYRRKMAAILDETAAKKSPENAMPKVALLGKPGPFTANDKDKKGKIADKVVIRIPPVGDSPGQEQEDDTSVAPQTLDEDDIVIPTGRKTFLRGHTAPAALETAHSTCYVTPDYPATPRSLCNDLKKAVLLSETFLKNSKSDLSSSEPEVEIRNFQLAGHKSPEMSVQTSDDSVDHNITPEATNWIKQLKTVKLRFPCIEGHGQCSCPGEATEQGHFEGVQRKTPDDLIEVKVTKKPELKVSTSKHIDTANSPDQADVKSNQTDNNGDDAETNISSKVSYTSDTKAEHRKPKGLLEHLLQFDDAENLKTYKMDEIVENETIYDSASSYPSENLFVIFHEETDKPIPKTARPTSKYNRKGSPTKGITKEQVSLLPVEDKNAIMTRFFSGLSEAEPVPDVKIIEKPLKGQSRPSTRILKTRHDLQQRSVPPVQGKAMMLVRPKSSSGNGVKQESEHAASYSGMNSKSPNLTNRSSNQLVSPTKISRPNSLQENSVSQKSFMDPTKKTGSPKLNKLNSKATPLPRSANSTIGGNVVLGLTTGRVNKRLPAKNNGSSETIVLPPINTKCIRPVPKTCSVRRSLNNIPKPATCTESKYYVRNYWIP